MCIRDRCRGSQKKALAIYQAASDGIITRSPDVTTSLALSQCLLMLKQASSSADLILRQMQSIAYTMPEYSIVRSMYGVGDRLAPILIAEIGDVRRFTSAKALNAYAGNDAPPYPVSYTHLIVSLGKSISSVQYTQVRLWSICACLNRP